MTFEDYAEAARATAIYDPQDAVTYPLIGLFGEIGEVAEKIKKVIRDHKGDMPEEVRMALKKELGDVLWYWTILTSDLGFTPSEVAAENLAKLQSRQKRGVLGGSGDNR